MEKLVLFELFYFNKYIINFRSCFKGIIFFKLRLSINAVTLCFCKYAIFYIRECLVKLFMFLIRTYKQILTQVY